MRAEGVGYLAPLATNATVEGRERNRRVEVVVDTGR
jgi:OOP family OmpA-OmpF porin